MDTAKIEKLAFGVVGDMGGAFTMALGYIGDQLGLFKAMAGAGPLSSSELAEKTNLNERYVREWGNAMVAAEYVDYDANAEKYVMTEEQAFCLANEDSPMFVGGAFHFTVPSLLNVDKIKDAFKNGGGISYSDIGKEIAPGIERFFKPGYIHSLASQWLPAVPGLTEKLLSGGMIADVGCGRGQSTIAMAKAFPKSSIIGIDFDHDSIEYARNLAKEKGLSNVTFHEGPADKFPGDDQYDLICSFDCIHDMVDPEATLKEIRRCLKEDGVHFWSEPNVSDQPLERRNPVGKAFSAISPLHCMTVSMAHGGAALGTVIGEKGAKKLADEAGFSKWEKLPIDNPFNLFFACRK